MPPLVFREITINIPKGCFHPKLGKISEHLLNYAKSCTERNTSVLDIGTGSGFYAVVLAKRLGCKAYGVDINSNDIASAQANAAANGVESLTHFETVSEKDPFAPISTNTKFDLIIANLPFSRTSAVFKSWRHPMANCFHGSRWLIERLLLGSVYHIKPNGKLIFAYAESGYGSFLDDLIAVSPWRVHGKSNPARSKDDSFNLYDLRLKDEFVQLVK